MSREPGPNQSDINRKQGIVNQKQGDLNDSLVDADMSHRQDVAEASAVAATEHRDAQFNQQAVVNERQTSQFDRQAATNEAQGITNADQALINAGAIDQATINNAAVETLREVGLAAKEVATLLQKNVTRARNWTIGLGLVVAGLIILGIGGAYRFRHDAEVLKQANQIRCEERNDQLAQTKMEFMSLVQQEVNFVAQTPEDRRQGQIFIDRYSARLKPKFQPIDCGR